jgi:hypothetical protein
VTSRGVSGVKLVTSDAHRGLLEAIGATLPGASWQRCRTHYAANLMSATPKCSWPWVRALLLWVYDQPDAVSVQAQFDRILEALTEKLPKVAEHLDPARADVLACTGFPKEGTDPQSASSRGSPCSEHTPPCEPTRIGRTMAGLHTLTSGQQRDSPSYRRRLRRPAEVQRAARIFCTNNLTKPFGGSKPPSHWGGCFYRALSSTPRFPCAKYDPF